MAEFRVLGPLSLSQANQPVSHGSRVDFRVLGPLQASRDGAALPIGAAHKPRLVLAALLSRSHETVDVDWLIGVVWGEQPPASARRNIQHYVHRLRVAMGSDRISSRPGGYQIRAGDGLDVARFCQLTADGSTALRAGSPKLARERLRAALQLWRGRAYAEFTDCPVLADEADRLDELRLTALEHWAEAELALGDHSVLVSALPDLVRQHPYRENLRGQLMRALYGSGRRADALDLYRSTRTLLVEQLGIEPAPQLQRLHEQILRGDVRLSAPVPYVRTTPCPPTVSPSPAARPNRGRWT
jgi:DNA-binding SARP family transcriptional activator